MTSLASALPRAWLRRGLLAWSLLPLALLFGILAALRRRLYRSGLLRSTRLPVPVIVVGNIFVGGTGKTPLTIWLVQALRAAGYTPGVISRGYGADNTVPQAVDADASPSRVGDEPLLIAQRAGCPVMVGRARVAAAQALLAAHPAVDVIVSDDGLQHYALQRDIEIVLSDARGAGNGWLLPAGPLREPASRRRDFTVVNAARADSGQFRMQLAGDHAEALADPARRCALADLPRTRVLAAAGIGNPARFFAMLRDAGLAFDEMALPDHYDFTLDPFAAVDADLILVTEKDAVKCRHSERLKHDPRLWVVPVTARLDGALAEKIVEKLRGHPTA